MEKNNLFFIVNKKIENKCEIDPLGVNVWQEIIWHKLEGLNELKIYCYGEGLTVMKLFIKRWVENRKVLTCEINLNSTIPFENNTSEKKGNATEIHLKKRDFLWEKNER